MRVDLSHGDSSLITHPQSAMVIFTNGDHGQAAYSWVFRKIVGDAAALAWI
jgi:hypothetical protein